jgi:hypothetical protein
VQNIELAYRVFSKLGGIEPPNLLAIPPQVASAEPGDSRVHVEIDWIQPSWCTPAEWQQITSEMEVLAGDWVESCYTPVRKRYKLFEDE